jgi:hypothetical protein
VSRSDLVDKIDETGCCDRLFGQVVVTGYLYRFGAWLMHLFMVQVWCMVDALVHGTGFVQVWCMVDALVHGTCFVQVGAWLMHLFMVQVLVQLVQQQYISQ